MEQGSFQVGKCIMWFVSHGETFPNRFLRRSQEELFQYHREMLQVSHRETKNAQKEFTFDWVLILKEHLFAF